MNVAALLHDSPSDDLRRRQARQEQPQEQQPQPPQPSQRPPHHSPPLERPRDQLRDRDRPPQDLPLPSHPHGQPPLAYRRSPPPHHPSHPSSPPRHAPPAYGAPPAPGGDFPAHPSSSQRHHLPPPSTLLSEPPYEGVGGGHGSRREQLPHPHDRLGPPPGGDESPLGSGRGGLGVLLFWCAVSVLPRDLGGIRGRTQSSKHEFSAGWCYRRGPLSHNAYINHPIFLCVGCFHALRGGSLGVNRSLNSCRRVCVMPLSGPMIVVSLVMKRYIWNLHEVEGCSAVVHKGCKVVRQRNVVRSATQGRILLEDLKVPIALTGVF